MTSGDSLKACDKVRGGEQAVPFFHLREEGSVVLQLLQGVYVHPFLSPKALAKEYFIFSGSGNRNLEGALFGRVLPPPHAYLVQRKRSLSRPFQKP